MSIVDDFTQKKYVHIKKLLTDDQCRLLTDLLKKEIEEKGWHDEQCPKSKSIKNSPTFNTVLSDFLPHMEEITGLKLLPTYAYARWYVPGEELKPHLDRHACEVSATLTLGFDGDNWPIFIGYPSEKKDTELLGDDNNKMYVENVEKINMDIGDLVVYRGCEMIHWREKYKEGKWQAQVFLHYVDANGPNKDWVYDKNPSLNTVANVDDLTYWYYTDVLTEQDCDMLVKTYANYKGEQADVGKTGNTSEIDKSIRNVNKIVLPTYKGIGAILAAAGFDANAQRWNFNVDKANQCEFLMYPSGGGRYKGHIDTFLSKMPQHMTECRKVTVLAFLNDDFDGGKFFLQIGSERFYPPQKKGTVLVFPSFILHGVEDVGTGTRYSAVCWLVGPWFK